MADPTATDFAEKDGRAGALPAQADGPLSTLNDEQVRRMSVIPGFAEVTDAAAAGSAAEKRMSIREGLRLYPKAIGWSMLLSTAIVMEGYDVVLLGSFFAFPQFQQKYGDLQPDGTYRLENEFRYLITSSSSPSLPKTSRCCWRPRSCAGEQTIAPPPGPDAELTRPAGSRGACSRR